MHQKHGEALIVPPPPIASTARPSRSLSNQAASTCPILFVIPRPCQQRGTAAADAAVAAGRHLGQGPYRLGVWQSVGCQGLDAVCLAGEDWRRFLAGSLRLGVF